MKAMIFAAGLGTRLKPLTDTMPKALVPIGEKTLLEHVILKLKASGFTEIIINVHHFSEMIIDFLKLKDNFGIDICISNEKDELLDTGGGIRKAGYFFDDEKPFLVHNVDILSDINLNELYQFHLKTTPLATLVVSERDTFRYMLFDDKNRLRGWTNLKTGEIKPEALKDISSLKRLAFSGIHILSPKVFDLMKDFGNKFSIMNFYLSNVDNEVIKGYIPQNFHMLDVGKLDILDKAEQFISEPWYTGKCL